jgi:hypothetical protein
MTMLAGPKLLAARRLSPIVVMSFQALGVHSNPDAFHRWFPCAYTQN